MKARVIKTGEIVDIYHEPQHGQITNIYKESVLVNGRMWSEDELDFCMRANEAPEKLYISYKGYGVFSEDSSTERTNISQIEYTRTDAFIEKVSAWIKKMFSETDQRFNQDYTGMLINDFKETFKQ